MVTGSTHEEQAGADEQRWKEAVQLHVLGNPRRQVPRGKGLLRAEN